MTAPLLLVDGSSYLYRAFHASYKADLRTSSGLPTGALRVIATMLRSLRQQYPESPMAVVFDAPGKNFRHELYPDYKATRSSMPDDLRAQVEAVLALVEAMGFHLLRIEGVEADDVIGTLARQATEQQIPTLISTGDKDMAQLVSESVTLIDTMKGERTDREGVINKFGVPPELIVDLLAFMGDTSDNIPGMAGVGDKTAVALLQGLGGVETIAANLDKVAALGFRGAKGFAEKFREQEAKVRLSYQLATIKQDVELPCSLNDLALNQPNLAKLREIYQQFELYSLLNELGGEESVAVAAAPSAPSNVTYQLILDEADWLSWLARLQQAEYFAFDLETDGLDPHQARIVGCSIAVQEGEAAYIPLGHDYLGAPEQLKAETVFAALKPLLEDPTRLKIGQNLKFDRNMLRQMGITLRGIRDTMLAAYLLNPSAGRFNLEALVERYLKIPCIAFTDIAGKGKKQLTFNQIELEQAYPYACEDADLALRLHHHLTSELRQFPELEKLYLELELPLVEVLAEMEWIGTRIDAARLQKQSLELGQRLQELEREAYELAGEPFNLNSPKQLGVILFEKLGLPVVKKTATGAASTAEEVLVELAPQHPLPQLLLTQRELAKLKSTYTDPLPLLIKPTTQRIHTSYNQTGTVTGRLSSSEPNLQNIPVRNEEGRRIRQAFVPAEGFTLVAADYSQIELRIMAHLSGDAGLLRAFANGEDIHRATAAEVLGLAPAEVTTEMRRRAKAINFGLIYGMSAFGLAKQLDIGRAEAQHYMDRYFDRYPGVLSYMERTKEQAQEQGYVETLFGRRLYLPAINGRGLERKAAERAAINAPMQGSAADIIKRAMLAVAAWIETECPDQVRMLMQVHDELVFEVKPEFVATATAKIRQLMEGVAELAVPLSVDVGEGCNWDQAH